MNELKEGDTVAIKRTGEIGKLVQWVTIAGKRKAQLKMSGKYSGILHIDETQIERAY